MLKKIYDWIVARDDVGHIIEATVLFLVMIPLMRWPVLAVVIYFYAREKGQWEFVFKRKKGIKSILPYWYRGLWPGEWYKDNWQDFAWPVSWALIMQAIFEYLR